MWNFALPLLILTSLTASASELRSVAPTKEQKTTTLPLCIDDPAAIEKIKTTIKANSKTAFKYDGYKQALQSDSDEELMARLVYAETIAANCPELNTVIAKRIAAAIANRVRIRKGDVRNVIFQRDQFSSSMNIYVESKYLVFLCPNDSLVWNSILKITKDELAKSSGILSKDTVNYFLYKHSPRWTKEPWEFKEDESQTNSNIQSCVRTFHVPGWK